jgi:hypothetical protein
MGINSSVSESVYAHFNGLLTQARGLLAGKPGYVI